MTNESSQVFDSYLSTYEVVPDDYEEAKGALVEHFRKVSESVNAKEIGYYLEEELLTGGSFVPSDNSQGQNRSIFRKVIDASPLVAGANSVSHGINFDSRFTLVKLYISATDSTGFTAIMMTYPEVDMDATNININSPNAYDRAWCTVEYLLED